jgi:hypothetical protein
VVSPCVWLVSIILFLLSTRHIAIGNWGNYVSSHRLVRAVVVITKWQKPCPPGTILFGWLLPQLGGAIQFWVLPSVPGEQLQDPTPGLLWRSACHPTPTLILSCFSHICSLRVWHWEFGSLPRLCSQVQCSNPTSAFLFFSFVGGGGSSLPRAALDYVPGRWVGESHMVRDAHLLILQIHTSSFGSSLWGEMVYHFSMAWHREAFHGLGVQDVAEFNSNWHSTFSLLEEKKKKKRNGQGSFFPGGDTPCYLCHVGFSKLLVTIKSCFKG